MNPEASFPMCLVHLLRRMDAAQQSSDEDGGREVSWYYFRDDVEDCLGLDRGDLDSVLAKEQGLPSHTRSSTMSELTTWRKALDHVRWIVEDQTPIIAVAPDETVLDVQFDPGYDGSEGPAVLVWSEERVYFPAVYDGAEWMASAPLVDVWDSSSNTYSDRHIVLRLKAFASALGIEVTDE